jgi:hypothetical protein
MANQTKTNSRQKQSDEDTQQIRRVSSPRISAGKCPVNASHEHTIIYKTVGRVRRCKCNDCGATWKLTGPFADELREYAVTLSETLRNAPRTKDGADDVILITDDLASEIADKLHKLATT